MPTPPAPAPELTTGEIIETAVAEGRAPAPDVPVVPASTPAIIVQRKQVDLVPILLAVVVVYLVWRATRPAPTAPAPVAS